MGVWYVTYTPHVHIQVLISVRDITRDDIFTRNKEVKIPIRSFFFLLKNTDVSMDLVWHISSTKEMFLI